MEARPYFSKFGHRVSRKYWNRDVNNASLLPVKPILALMGSYRLLTFAYFKPFPGLKYTAGPDWSKKFVTQTSEHRLCIKTLRKLAIFWYGGFEAVRVKWLHETDEEEEESTKPRKQTPTRQQTFKKRLVGISKTAHTVHCFWRKCSAVFDWKRLSQM